ncbi:MAG: saccharopine dehydrogenase family protein [Gammaproteobacteria bacterium]|nr:saccharopine dehydrogenase family protein [Gammaproteobacteria bacterium]
MTGILIIGAGGVGSATAHKCAQHNDELGDICLASRTLEKCDAVIEAINGKGNKKNQHARVFSAQVDAMDTKQIVDLITRTQSDLILNVASPYCNKTIMEACLETRTHYLDTAVYEQEGNINEPPPWYANYEWKYKDDFIAHGVTGVLGIGFDPGAVNAFCAYVHKHLIDTIDTIDIMDVNAGRHGRFFATNFDPETNLREIMEDVIYWENGKFVKIPHHSKSITYDFPQLGGHRVYSMGHDELHSLPFNIPANRIEFWMGFNDRYINCFNVLEELGLLSNQPVEVEGKNIVPIKLLKAVLPDPSSLAQDYFGKVCIGCLINGTQGGIKKEIFIYTLCDHTECYKETGSQAISYTTAVPLVTAAILVTRGDWNVRQLVNVEELDPDPFMKLMPKLGLDWDVRVSQIS